MGYLRLEEAWQMVKHYFPGVAVTAAQVSTDFLEVPTLRGSLMSSHGSRL